MEPVYFNTEFVFTCHTWDLPQFDGEYEHIIDTASVKWTNQHIPIIQTYLRDMMLEYGYPEIDVSVFPLTIQGTRKLVDRLRLGHEKYGDISCNYIFGYIVWHQLLYCNPLDCVYLTGVPSDFD